MEQRETDNRLPFSMPVLVLLRPVEISTFALWALWRGIYPPGGGAWGKDIEKEDSMEIVMRKVSELTPYEKNAKTHETCCVFSSPSR